MGDPSTRDSLDVYRGRNVVSGKDRFNGFLVELSPNRLYRGYNLWWTKYDMAILGTRVGGLLYRLGYVILSLDNIFKLILKFYIRLNQVRTEILPPFGINLEQIETRNPPNC